MSIYSPEKAWGELYRAALFETDKTKTAERIADAARVMKARARSLFDNPDNSSAERNALDAAFYALSVLKLYTRIQQNTLNEAVISVLPRNAWVARGTNERTR